MNWENFRRADKTLDLLAAFESEYPLVSGDSLELAKRYLAEIESLARISSRQVAAHALVAAKAYVTLSFELKLKSVL